MVKMLKWKIGLGLMLFLVVVAVSVTLANSNSVPPIFDGDWSNCNAYLPVDGEATCRLAMTAREDLDPFEVHVQATAGIEIEDVSISPIGEVAAIGKRWIVDVRFRVVEASPQQVLVTAKVTDMPLLKRGQDFVFEINPAPPQEPKRVIEREDGPPLKVY